MYFISNINTKSLTLVRKKIRVTAINKCWKQNVDTQVLKSVVIVVTAVLYVHDTSHNIFL
jgi:hypothetical protein